jgi:putative oxidoreductase
MIPERFAPHVYPLFRFVFGFLFLFHGLQKFGLLDMAMVPLVSRSGAAAVIELTCGTLIALGAFVRPAAFIASGEMAFAYFISHSPRGLLPIENRGELAVLYCFAFLYIASRGGGRFALTR